jgi:hypothetical protein
LIQLDLFSIQSSYRIFLFQLPISQTSNALHLLQFSLFDSLDLPYIYPVYLTLLLKLLYSLPTFSNPIQAYAEPNLIYPKQPILTHFSFFFFFFFIND